MARPCACALGSLNVEAKRWSTRADIFDQIRAACIYLDTEDLAEVSLQSAAQRASLSEFHFTRVFKETMGISPSIYLQKRRLKDASLRLAQTSDKVSVIADDCGYQNASAFSRAFVREFGHPPTAHRKLANQA
ncbi:MAG: AraC family transcriptional regulator [Fimbriimonadaceae bacterium]